MFILFGHTWLCSDLTTVFVLSNHSWWDCSLNLFMQSKHFNQWTCLLPVGYLFFILLMHVEHQKSKLNLKCKWKIIINMLKCFVIQYFPYKVVLKPGYWKLWSYCLLLDHTNQFFYLPSIFFVYFWELRNTKWCSGFTSYSRKPGETYG